MASFKISLTIVAFMALSIAHFSIADDSHQDVLDAHNKARAEVGIPPLTWNQTVEAYAENYAKKRENDCQLEHSMGPLYGENLATGGGEMSIVDGVNMWVGEKKFFDPKSNSCVGDECLHYTAIVWKKTTDVGCARVKCKNSDWFVICNYWPMPNIEGERPY